MQQVSIFLNRYKYYLFLLLATLAIFWPLTFNIFSLKNDALVYFLPYRYHISESIQNGNFPWWNPYIYTGLPLHSDIQSGVWNPVVMLISVFTTYNMTVLQWELLFYLFIASIGMYLLVREFVKVPSAAVITAIAYICCGFMTDSGSLIPWITSAAYLPFVFLFYYRLLHRPELKIALKFSISLVLLITAGYPSFFIYCLYAMLAGIIAWLIYTRPKKEFILSLLLYFFIAGSVFVLITGPAILSWWDFMSYYDRGGGATLNRSLTNPFPAFSSLSYLLASVVSKEHPWLISDLSARNASVGIFMFLLFVTAVFSKLSFAQKFILAGTLFSFFFSLGDLTPVREWCYRLLPLMNSFRHPGSIRLFTTIGILLIAAPLLKQLLVNPGSIKKKLLFLCSVSAVVIVIFMIFYSNGLHLLRAGTGFNKSSLDRLGFADLLFIMGIIQLTFLSAFLFCVYSSKKKIIPVLIIINSVICCWVALPFTFISQVKTATIDDLIASFPKGTPSPDLQYPVKAMTFGDSAILWPYGYDHFYKKQINIQDYVITPTINNNYTEFLADKKLRRLVDDYPFIYLSDTTISSNAFQDININKYGKIVLFDSYARQLPVYNHTKGEIKLIHFSYNEMEFATTTEEYGLLNIFQQYHHNWHFKVDDHETGTYRTNKAFMSLLVPAGKHVVSLRYIPADPIPFSIYLSCTVLLVLMIYFIFHAIKNNRRA